MTRQKSGYNSESTWQEFKKRHILWLASHHTSRSQLWGGGGERGREAATLGSLSGLPLTHTPSPPHWTWQLRCRTGEGGGPTCLVAPAPPCCNRFNRQLTFTPHHLNGCRCCSHCGLVSYLKKLSSPAVATTTFIPTCGSKSGFATTDGSVPLTAWSLCGGATSSNRLEQLLILSRETKILLMQLKSVLILLCIDSRKPQTERSTSDEISKHFYWCSDNVDEKHVKHTESKWYLWNAKIFWAWVVALWTSETSFLISKKQQNKKNTRKTTTITNFQTAGEVFWGWCVALLARDWFSYQHQHKNQKWQGKQQKRQK